MTISAATRSNRVEPNAVRRTVLDMLYRSKASHLGTNMSEIEILIAIFGAVDCIKIRDHAPDRSRVIISKGHGAAATYATMAHYGIIPFALLDSYHSNGSKLAGHVSHGVPGVEHSTGALGHGLSVAVGAAIGLRSRGFSSVPVFAVCGDGEIQEGSIWEAVMLARHLNLSNLVMLLDNNRISSITDTDKVIDLRPIERRFAGFDVFSCTVDGHSTEAVSAAIQRSLASGKPGVIVCDTIKGKGVAFAEGQPIWHYRSLNDDLYRQAIDGLI
ncbi:MAG: transketolase [Alphaproteobacteria bacterium]|nr:transketolase [Alphaproteobacteria bacterium]